MSRKIKKENPRHGLGVTVFILLSAALLSACGKSTDEVPVGEVGMEFFITREDADTIDSSGDAQSSLHGNLFTTIDSYKERLQLSPTERLTIFDGVHEHDLHYNRFTGEFLLQLPDIAKDDAPSYVLRYYRRDGEVLESRIETPVMPDFIAPQLDSEWLPREQVLRVEWAESLVPVQELVLESPCRVPDENGETAMHFPVSKVTQLDIDLSKGPHEENCSTDDASVHLVQTPVSASSIDSRFLSESRFELQRRRERHIRERT